MKKRLNGNIVIIDDHVLVRQALGDCMEFAGYAVDSVDSAERFRDVAMKHGAAGFLSKPFRRGDLVKLVGAAIQE